MSKLTLLTKSSDLTKNRSYGFWVEIPTGQVSRSDVCGGLGWQPNQLPPQSSRPSTLNPIINYELSTNLTSVLNRATH